MKIKFILPIVFLFVLLILPTVESWGVHTHNRLAEEILHENTTTIGIMCGANELNKQAYLLGCVAPDLSVIYYFEEGGKEYRLSHNFNFQQEIMSRAKTEDERCFAWGISAHLIQDGIAHTQAVPKGIEKYHIPNWLLHPLIEKKYDSAIALKYPSLITSTPRMMDALDGPQGERYIEMIDYAMGENSELNVKNELTKLRIALDSFYESQFRPSGDTWIFEAYSRIDKLTNFLAPYIGTMNFGSIDHYYEKSKEQTENVFNNWGTRYQISPHGFTELSTADKGTANTFTWIFIIVVSLPLLLAYWKRQPLYILLSPLMIILLIIGVYALL